MSKVVLDASALLALLNAEPGSRAVEENLSGAAVSAVNLSEVIAKLSERGMPEAAIRTALEGLGLDVRPFDTAMAYSAGTLRAATRGLGLSLGDRACLALGATLNGARADRRPRLEEAQSRRQGSGDSMTTGRRSVPPETVPLVVRADFYLSRFTPRWQKPWRRAL